MRRLAFVGCLLAGCGSTVILVKPDGQPEDGPADSAVAGEGGLDVNPEAWFSRFDAGAFDGLPPPVVGSYPPLGPGPCYESGCAGTAQCGLATGWCCSGEWKNKLCVCGYGLGCLPPETCCGLPGAYVPVCAASADACRGDGGKPPWEK